LYPAAATGCATSLWHGSFSAGTERKTEAVDLRDKPLKEERSETAALLLGLLVPTGVQIACSIVATAYQETISVGSANNS